MDFQENYNDTENKNTNDDFLTEDDRKNPKYQEGNTSFWGAFIQIGNTILGAGIISLPVVIRYLGFILGIIFIAIIALLTIYSSYLLLKAHQITKKKKIFFHSPCCYGGEGIYFHKCHDNFK